MRKNSAVARVLSGDLTKKGVVLLKSESRKTKKGFWISEDLDDMMHAQDLAKAMKIPADHFRWYAAFHNEGHHPHIHMMVWSDDPKEGFLTREGIAAMRSKLTNTIFRDEMIQIYERKDVAYKELIEAAQDTMRELIQKMEHLLRRSLPSS